MQELRRTVALLRRDDETGVAPPLPSVAGVGLVEEARAGGRRPAQGDLTRLHPASACMAYRIAQEALANAARHAPRAHTVLGLGLTNGQVELVAETGSLRCCAGRRARTTALRADRNAGAGDGTRRRVLRRTDAGRLAGDLPDPGRRLTLPVIRAALVDGQAIVRAGLARILSPADSFEIVAECADGREAVELLPALHPDVVLMDIRMPDYRRHCGNGATPGRRGPTQRPRVDDLRRGRGALGRDRGGRRRVSCSRTAPPRI